MKGLSKAHNNSKRRREDKAILRVLRNPQKREQLINGLIEDNVVRTPMRNMVRQVK